MHSQAKDNMPQEVSHDMAMAVSNVVIPQAATGIVEIAPTFDHQVLGFFDDLTDIPIMRPQHLVRRFREIDCGVPVSPIPSLAGAAEVNPFCFWENCLGEIDEGCYFLVSFSPSFDPFLHLDDFFQRMLDRIHPQVKDEEVHVFCAYFFLDVVHGKLGE